MKTRHKPLRQTAISRRYAASSLSGRALQLGPYSPVVAFDDEGYRITDTRVARMSTKWLSSGAHPHIPGGDVTPVDTRQRRRAAARAAAKTPAVKAPVAA